MRSHDVQEIDARFRAYDKANPRVYAAFVRAARKLLRAGRSHYSARVILDGLAFNSDVRGAGDAFKINHDYTSRYARKLMDEHAEFSGFFELRRLG